MGEGLMTAQADLEAAHESHGLSLRDIVTRLELCKGTVRTSFVARLLNCSRRTVQWRIETCVYRGSRTGHAWHVDPASVIEDIKKRNPNDFPEARPTLRSGCGR